MVFKDVNSDELDQRDDESPLSFTNLSKTQTKKNFSKVDYLTKNQHTKTGVCLGRIIIVLCTKIVIKQNKEEEIFQWKI